MNKKAKALTGKKAVEAAIQPEVKTVAVEQERKELGFVDYYKAKNTIIEGRFTINGIQVGEDKKRHWVLNSVNPDGSRGKIIAYFGDRKENKGVYCRSDIKEICSEVVPEEKIEKVLIQA